MRTIITFTKMLKGGFPVKPVVLLCCLLLGCTTIEFEAESGPVLTLLGPDPYLLNIGDAYLEPGATAYDEGDGDITADIEIKNDDIFTINAGGYTVSYSVSNSDGEEETIERTVKVQDSDGSDYVKPVITLKGSNPEIVPIGITYTDPGATAEDDEDGDITSHLEIFDDVINTEMADTFTVWYMVEDAAGNVVIETRLVIVVETGDTIPPVITLKGDNPFNIELNGTYNEPGATANDNVDGDLSDEIVIDDSDIDTAVAGTYNVIYTVSDAAGNKADTVRIVHVGEIQDTVPPVITLKGNDPMSVVINQAYNEPGATAFDDIDGDLTDDIVIDKSNVNTSDAGTYTVTYTVSDEAGNEAEEKRTVKVVGEDTESPVITLLGNNPMNVKTGGNYDEPGATALDDIDGDLTDEIVIDESNINTSTAGTYIATYTVSDEAGNRADAERIVHVGEVEDSVPPVISLKGTNPMAVIINTVYTEPGATAYDDVDGDLTNEIVIDESNLNIAALGSYKVAYTVSDAAGNTADTTRIVYVVDGLDTLPPVISLKGADPMNVIINHTYFEPGATAYDSSDGDLTAGIVIDNSEVVTTAVGTYAVSYTVSDKFGNIAIKKRIVVVVNPGEDLLVEDFESGTNVQTTLAGINFGPNDGAWYGYKGEATTTINPDPIADPTFADVIDSSVGYNNSSGLHVTVILKRNRKYNAGVGFNLKTPGNYYNLSNLKSIKFLAKGSGIVRVILKTKRINEWLDPDENLGHFGKDFTLNATWKEHVISVSEIKPPPDSPQAVLKWDDSEVKDKVTTVEFEVKDDEGSYVELYLDDIKMEGVKVSDFQ